MIEMCDATGKRCFRDPRQAARFAALNKQFYHEPSVPYKCRSCWLWHLRSINVGDKEGKRAKRYRRCKSMVCIGGLAMNNDAHMAPEQREWPMKPVKVETIEERSCQSEIDEAWSNLATICNRIGKPLTKENWPILCGACPISHAMLAVFEHMLNLKLGPFHQCDLCDDYYPDRYLFDIKAVVRGGTKCCCFKCWGRLEERANQLAFSRESAPAGPEER